MAAEKENQFWKVRSKHGRDKLFETPELLWEAACEYFQWCDENPLQEAKAFAYQGSVSIENVSKMRAYTLEGLCLFLHCNDAYFRNFKSQNRINKEGFSTVISTIENTIYNQQFVGAAADLLNANIIARKLALPDRTERTLSVEQPLFGDIDDRLESLTEDELNLIIDQIKSKHG